MYRGAPEKSSIAISTGSSPTRSGSLPRRRRELEPQERCDLPRDAVDGEEVGPVSGDLEVEDDLPKRKHVPERRPRLALREDDDPRVILTQLELTLGQDHSGRHLAAKLPALEHEAAGQRRARESDGDSCACAEVPRPTDDLIRLALSDVDEAELEPVRVGMLPRLEHPADTEEPEIAVFVRDPSALHRLDDGCRDVEA